MVNLAVDERRDRRVGEALEPILSPGVVGLRPFVEEGCDARARGRCVEFYGWRLFRSKNLTDPGFAPLPGGDPDSLRSSVTFRPSVDRI